MDSEVEKGERMERTATQKRQHEQGLLDLRRRHADAISHAIMREVRHLIPSDVGGEVFEGIWEAIYRNGTMIISDKESAALGMEPKDERGWTPSDRVKFEEDKIALMHQMVDLTISTKPTGR